MDVTKKATRGKQKNVSLTQDYNHKVLGNTSTAVNVKCLEF